MEDESAEERESKSPELRADFEKSDEHIKFYTNGVYGGRTTRGDVMVEFYTEYNNLPDYQIYELERGNSIGSVKSTAGAEGIVRDTKATAFMKPENARSIGAWMIAKTLPDADEQDVRKCIEETFEGTSTSD